MCNSKWICAAVESNLCYAVKMSTLGQQKHMVRAQNAELRSAKGKGSKLCSSKKLFLMSCNFFSFVVCLDSRDRRP